nr:ABC transporter ATP-binding protein [Rhodococcus sp. 06-621-2]
MRWFLPPAVRSVLRQSALYSMLGVGCAAAAGLATVAAVTNMVWLLRNPSQWNASVVAAFLVTGAGLSAASSWFSHCAEARFAAHLRRRLARHLVRLPARTLARYDGDRLRRLVSDDVTALHHLVAHVPSETATLIVVPVATVFALVSIAGPTAVLVLLPGVAAALFYSTVVAKLGRRHSAEQGRVMTQITTAVDDYARGISVHRIYGAGGGAAAEYAVATDQFTRGTVGWVSKVATPAALASALLQATVTYAVAYAVGFDSGTEVLAALLLFGLAAVTPALRLEHGLDYIWAGRAAGGRLADLLDETPLPSGGTWIDRRTGGALQAQGITVNSGERAILGGLTHSFEQSAVTAVVGPSGSGKSTLLRVLAGFDVQDAGSVTVGGVDVRKLNQQFRHRSVFYVPQGTDVLQTSVRTDLRPTAPDAPDGSLLGALASAQLNVDLDTAAHELSGGERQRLRLAHSFLTSAQVILLDEPASALDGVTARAVFASIRNLAHREGKTIVLVTHDLALADQADDLVDLCARQVVSE